MARRHGMRCAAGAVACLPWSWRWAAGAGRQARQPCLHQVGHRPVPPPPPHANPRTEDTSPTPAGRSNRDLKNNTLAMAMSGQGPFTSCSRIGTELPWNEIRFTRYEPGPAMAGARPCYASSKHKLAARHSCLAGLRRVLGDPVCTRKCRTATRAAAWACSPAASSSRNLSTSEAAPCMGS